MTKFYDAVYSFERVGGYQFVKLYISMFEKWLESPQWLLAVSKPEVRMRVKSAWGQEYLLIQADPSRPTYPLCVPTAWGILISRQNCLLWSQAHMYFNSLRPSDSMAAKFWSSLLQPMACPQYGAKWVPEPIVT